MKLLKKIKEYAHTKPKTKKLIGVIAVLIGFAGVILPVIPGLWLMFFGLELLGVQILFFDKFITLLKEKRIVEKISANRVGFVVLSCILVFYWYSILLKR